MKLLLGLGNPGAGYRRTRHNVGFRLIDRLAERERVRLKRKLLASARVASFDKNGERVFLAKPQTYMNRSGTAAGKLMRKHGLDGGDLVVVYDDVALEPGQLRLRESGGAGGHNGVQSVIDALGSRSFPRIRVGVGAPRSGRSLTDHVLGRFAPDEDRIIELAIETGLDMIDCLLRDGAARAMSVYNKRTN